MVATLAQGLADALPQLIPAAVQGCDNHSTGDWLKTFRFFWTRRFSLSSDCPGLLDAIPQLWRHFPPSSGCVDFIVFSAIPQIIEAAFSF
jgi:hypothetical protein